MLHFKHPNSYLVVLLLILIGSVALACYALHNGMVFIGDQAWFYLSARDLLLGKSFPLVGITSSHTWLHQGPLWTYILAIALWVGRYNPLSGAYLSIGINLLTILFIYLLGKKIFSHKASLIASVLFAFSPYILELSVMPFCPSPIPLCSVIYFYSLYSWVTGSKGYLAISLMMLAILYNFELATVILGVPLILGMIYGFYFKKEWVVKLSRKDVPLAIVLGIVPMLPVIIYDFTHGFKQTIVYAGWLVLHPLRSLLGIGPHTQGSIGETLGFLYTRLGQLLFLPNFQVSLVIFLVSILLVIHRLKRREVKENEKIGYLLLLSWLFIAIAGIIFNRTPSDAYLPILFVGIFYIVGIAISLLPKTLFYIVIPVLTLCLVLNIITLIKHNYFVGIEGITISQQQSVVTKMIKLAGNRDFAIIGKGPGSQFRSYTMPYEYLAWYAGHPVDPSAKVVFIVQEEGNKITLTRK